MNKISIILFLIISSLSSCGDREDVLAEKLDGSWMIEHVKIDRENQADSIITSDLGVLVFESCEKEEGPCNGRKEMDSGENYTFQFQVSNPKGSVKTVSITFPDLEMSDYKFHDWGGSYEILELNDNLTLSCKGCSVATRSGGTAFEIKAKKL